MKVLIVEDTEYKIISLKSFINEIGIATAVEVARSFHGALKLIDSFRPNLVLLDMSLPTSQAEDGELEGRDRIFGGKQILAEMDFNGFVAVVVIVTQFDRFGDGENALEMTTLISQLKSEYPKLLAGGVYFSTIDSIWRDNLKSILLQKGILK